VRWPAGCRGQLGAVAVRKAATAIAARHRARAVVPPGLRHPALYVLLNSGNAAVRQPPVRYRTPSGALLWSHGGGTSAGAARQEKV